MSLSSFFKGNAKKIENRKVEVSDRFVDENGKPIKWEIQSISAAKADALKAECYTFNKKEGRVFDGDKYGKQLLLACLVYPNLNDVELQNSYNVMGAENLISVMLNVGEYNKLGNHVASICGVTENLEELVDEAKK